MTAAEKRMGKEDGGSALHNFECNENIEWHKAKIVSKEVGLR